MHCGEPVRGGNYPMRDLFYKGMRRLRSKEGSRYNASQASDHFTRQEVSFFLNVAFKKGPYILAYILVKFVFYQYF